ncbi:MAG: hypothetical protein HFG90_03870 [Acholeplasmatales bacterium]|jgi:hypothetical protein|nr:hypothetical protein [Acholeplasmatales bacterium]
MKRVVVLFLLFPLLFACSSREQEKEIVLQEILNSIAFPVYIEEDISLPEEIDGIRIEWESSNEEVISSTGKVMAKESDTSVELKAIASLEEQKFEKIFNVIVKGNSPLQSINYTKDYRFSMEEANAKKYPYYKGYLYPGLRDKDGQEHLAFKENHTIGKSINVRLFGARPNDIAFDNTLAFQNAIASAKPGDEVFVPRGKYYFKTAIVTSPYYAHLRLASGVNFRGEGKDQSILISDFQKGENGSKAYGKKTATLVCGNMSNSMISDLGFSATADDSCLPKDMNDTKSNNPEGNQHAPAFGIVVYNTSIQGLTENIYIQNVYIEYFQYDGIRLYCTRNCKIANSVITKATDIGGGGAGYGIEIRGYGHEYFQYIDTRLDSCYNIVEEVEVIGPYIRHGIILSYMTHNNLFYKNKVLDSADDAFDVHGQDEFLNVFSQNYAKCSRRGAGLGLGNTGSTHDESGYGNIAYENHFIGCKYGVTVARGTKYTQLIKNKIEECSYTIYINDGPYTVQKDNIIISKKKGMIE